MPYRIASDGLTVEHLKGGKWSTKQVAKSKQNAHVIVAELEALDSGRIKKWGDRFTARKGKK